MHKVHIWMGAYGARTPKGTFLYSTHECITELAGQPLPNTMGNTDLAKHYVDGQGRPRVTGSGTLKESQHYPEPVGHAGASVYERHKSHIFTQAKAAQRDPLKNTNLMEILEPTTQTSWRDAHVRQVLNFAAGPR